MVDHACTAPATDLEPESMTIRGLPRNNDAAIRMIDNLNAMQAETRARTGWHDTKDENYEVVFASADKAHVILRPATRVRANGSAIATISAFYALTRRSSGWKIFVISAVIEPA